MQPTDEFEVEARLRGFRCVAGLDEAGRGPLAGPVVAAAVVLPSRCRILGLNDSKILSAQAREQIYGVLLDRAVTIGVGQATAEEIDTINILEATRLAMKRAVRACRVSPDFLLLDALVLPGLSVPQRSVIKGDQLSVSIAAASVVAKVTRDQIMVALHAQYPQYDFAKHKGYGTEEHLRLLERHGPSPIHRQSFSPVKRAAVASASFTSQNGAVPV